MGCTSGCFKCFLNVLNTVYALFGLLIIGLATLGLHQAPTAYIIYLYVIGGVLFASSIIGCCGICQESVCLTTTYGFLLLTLLVVQLLGLFGKKFDMDYIKRFAVDDVDANWNQEMVNPGAMDKIQRTYTCCGRNGPDDYASIGRETLPDSCYADGKTNLPYYTTGCVKAAADEFLINFNYVNNSKWGSVAVTALLCFCTFYLVHRFRKERRRYTYHY
ncbi:23 kDa integral membrane protein [Drosophila grimshawi]|uniref:GH21506 n=1 Tax=Drosophila grimshawi TaxID=7222 RepID=B4J3X5_DROGR|nr:23 kDa integral membrane protein [Drosophila grimshawi]EDW01558.1 GH21506 [Drosophila grimshawi]